MKSANYGNSIVNDRQNGSVAQQFPSRAIALGKSPLDDLLARPDAKQVELEQANKQDDKGQTLLHHAAYKGDVPEVTRLLSLKVINLDAQGFQYKDTPLHKAVHGGHLEVVILLLGAGAKVDIGNKNGELPLHYASYEGRLEILGHLISRMKELNISLDTPDTKFGDTALHKAALSDHKDASQIAEVLILGGAQFNSQNAEGKTPAHYATYKLKAQFIEALGRNGDKFNTHDKAGYLPIHKITEERNVAKADEEKTIKKIYAAGKALIDANADINGIEAENKTAISNAAWNKDLLGIIVLRLLGADVNIPDKYGCLPESKPLGDNADKAKVLLDLPYDNIAKLTAEYHLDLIGADAPESAAAHG